MKSKKTKKKKLYEITMDQYKTFYVLASSQKRALEDAEYAGIDFEWEYGDSEAVEIEPERAKFILQMRPKKVASYE